MKLLTAFLFTFLSVVTALASAAETTTASLLERLDDVLDRRDTYYVTREYRIDSLKNIAARVPLDDHAARARAFHDIFTEYGSFQGDSALTYATREFEEAKLSGNNDHIVRAQSDLIFTYLSGGSFTDAVDIVHRMDLSKASQEEKVNFYYLCIRLFSDLSNYAVADFSDKYARMSGQYCDSVMAIAPRNSYEYQYAMAFSPRRSLKVNDKIVVFQQLLDRPDVDLGTKAMLASILGDFYLQAGDQDKYEYYKVKSAILDVQSAKRETVSKLDLGRTMFEKGDVERAYRYIDLAKEDADFYNARNRKFQIMSILPLVEKARYMEVNKNRKGWAITSLVIIILLILAVVDIFVIVKQLRLVRTARKVADEKTREAEIKNHEVEQRNREVEQKNAELHKLLNEVKESNKIKDEYIGYGFFVHAEYIKKLESLYNLVDRKLMARQYDDLRKTLRHSDIRKEKESMHEDFDRIFLRLFPDFVTEYKKLFDEDDAKNAESNGHNLTSEMRIFALIRLGITDVSNIALFLNYSVNTVNTYKTKAKNRSNLDNEDFEAAIMRIKST